MPKYIHWHSITARNQEKERSAKVVITVLHDQEK
jgi:hypothetical protein